MKSGIYEIVCTRSGKSYVGQSKNVTGRLSSHRNSLQKYYQTKKFDEDFQSNKNLAKDWVRYGEENFIFRVLERCPHKKLNERERFWGNQWGKGSYNTKTLKPVWYNNLLGKVLIGCFGLLFLVVVS